VSVKENVGGSLSWYWNNLGFSSGDEVLVREKRPPLLAVRRRCWPFAAGGGPLVGLEQGRSWCLGWWPREVGDEVRVAFLCMALGFV